MTSNSPTEDTDRDTSVGAYKNASYRNYVLLLLTITYAFNFIDRQILVILQEPIKQDLGLSDTQLGLLSGLAFAALYIVMGIPVARLADNWVRKHILSVSLASWSLFTVLCGTAQNFVQILLARIGVGATESGCNPPAHSMIADMFPLSKRATALSVYAMGINIGVLCGFLFGGWLNQLFGWRVAFIAAGVTGILLALVIHFTVQEPKRGLHDNSPQRDTKIPFLNALGILWKIKTLRYIILGSSFFSLISYAKTIWFAPHILRNFDIQTGELGTWLALLSGLLGGAGTLACGYLADKKGKQDVSWYMWIPIISVLLTAPFLVFAFTSDSLYHALLLLVVPAIFGTAYIAPGLAIVQTIVDTRMRALASAIIIFVVNLIGLGLGPVLVGILSDILSEQHGSMSIGHAMTYVIILASLVTAWFYLAASKHVSKDVTKHL